MNEILRNITSHYTTVFVDIQIGNDIYKENVQIDPHEAKQLDIFYN